MTSMRRHRCDVITSHRHYDVMCLLGIWPPPPWPPQYSKPCPPPNILNLPTPMNNMYFQIGLYRFFLFCSLPYNIAGAVMTGTRGICSNMEDCVYQENYAVNLAMAISITALHGFSFFHALMISSKSSQTENEVRQSS